MKLWVISWIRCPSVRFGTNGGDSSAGELLWQFEQVRSRASDRAGRGVSVGLVTWLQTHRLLVSTARSRPCRVSWRSRCSSRSARRSRPSGGQPDGSGNGRELASMVFNEEIDAALSWCRSDRKSGCSRAIACALAVPLLTVVIDASALLGSLLAELVRASRRSHCSGTRHCSFSNCLTSFRHAQDGVFGLLSAWSPADGLHAERSAEALGGPPSRGLFGLTWLSSPQTS